MSDNKSVLAIEEILKASKPTGGGPKTQMPIGEWVDSLNDVGLIGIPTFHGVKGDQIGHRSGEIHIQLRMVLTRYFYVYRVPESDEQPMLFVTLKKATLVSAGVPKTAVQEYKEA